MCHIREAEIQEKWDKLHERIFDALVAGKIQYNGDVEHARHGLEVAVRIENYEAAQFFKEYIENKQ